jgi:hypothetical protein
LDPVFQSVQACYLDLEYLSVTEFLSDQAWYLDLVFQSVTVYPLDQVFP